MKAFPDPRLSDTQNNSSKSLNNPDLRGMDLRDYFAGQAMQTFLTNEWVSTFNDLGLGTAEMEIIVAKMSYSMADQMMEARIIKDNGKT